MPAMRRLWNASPSLPCGASLLDFINAQSEYRGVQLSDIGLVGSYLTADGQLNLAVGREVMQ